MNPLGVRTRFKCREMILNWYPPQVSGAISIAYVVMSYVCIPTSVLTSLCSVDRYVVIGKGEGISVRNLCDPAYSSVPFMDTPHTHAHTKHSIALHCLLSSPPTAALIHQSVLVRKKDIRKFLDGIYVSEKTTVQAVEE